MSSPRLVKTWYRLFPTPATLQLLFWHTGLLPWRMEDHSSWVTFPILSRAALCGHRRGSPCRGMSTLTGHIKDGVSNKRDTLLKGAITSLLLPLVKIFSDSTLEEISNSQLFRLKQHTLPWRFEIKHLPGRSNHAADAASRQPSPSGTLNNTFLGTPSLPDFIKSALMASIRNETQELSTIP